MIKMKDSGIDWIGSMPEHWEIKKIANHFKMRKVKVSDKDYAPLSVAKIGVVPQMENVAKSDASDDRKLVLKGDFVINSRSDRKQSCGVAQQDGSVSLINIVIEPRNIDLGYVGYVLKNYGFAEEFYRWGHGIVADLWTTNWEDMKKISIPIPPKEEQQRIADFLDKKCSQIERLIKLQENEIEKLKEYKTSLITEKVSYGIEKNVVLRESGIEWLGSVPEHWEVKKLKFAYVNRNEKYTEGEYPYIALENIESHSGLYVETDTNANYELAGSILAEQGDVIFGKLRPYLAKALNIREKSYVSSEFAVFGSSVNSTEFLKYLFLSSKFIDVINSSTYGTKMPRANIDFIRNLEIGVPSREEQEKIVELLNKKCCKIDELVAIKKKKIKELEEYKKSLIYECVTGKKEI